MVGSRGYFSLYDPSAAESRPRFGPPGFQDRTPSPGSGPEALVAWRLAAGGPLRWMACRCGWLAVLSCLLLAVRPLLVAVRPYIFAVAGPSVRCACRCIKSTKYSRQYIRFDRFIHGKYDLVLIPCHIIQVYCFQLFVKLLFCEELKNIETIVSQCFPTLDI